MPLCPLTNSEDNTLISVIPSSQIIRDWQKTFQIDVTNELQGVQEIYLYQCNRTKLFFFEPISVAASGFLYEKLQDFDWFYMPHKWEHDMALNDLKDCHKVLEIGCAFGSFVEKALESGLEIRGIEFNKAAVKVAKSKGLPVMNMGVKEFSNSQPASLDAICSFQVLEHISTPRDFLDYSIQSLKTGGKLILCVPNADSFLKHQYNLLDMPPHHMLRWSETTFRSLEKLFPIQLEKVLREPLASYHVSGYLGSYSSFFRAQSPLGKIFFNRYSLKLYERLLQLGLRKFLTGQSLYVQFRKLS